LKAPDTTAGKRVKCPKCGDPITVPAAEVEYEMVDDDPPPTPAKKKPQLIEDDDEPPRPAKTKAKSKSAPVEVDEAVDDEEEEEEDEKPKKKAGKRKKGKNREEEKKKRMITLILGLCGAVVVLGAAGGVVAFALNMADPAKVTAPTKPAPPPLPAGWSTFNGDGFSVAVPDSVQFKKQEQPPNVGGARGQPPPDAKIYTNGVQPQPGQAVNVYVVSIGTMPAEVKAAFDKSPQAGWDAIKKGGAAANQIQGEKTIQVGGAEGRQFTLNAGIIAGLVRVVVKGDKIYSWAVMAQAAPAEDGPEAKPFFDTFKFE